VLKLGHHWPALFENSLMITRSSHIFTQVSATSKLFNQLIFFADIFPNDAVTWSDVSFDASNYSVSTASRNSKKLRDSSPGTETFTFDTRRDAMEFYQCLKVLIPLHRRSWKRAVVALGPVNTQYRIDTPEDLELSAEKLSRAVDLRQGSDRDSLEDVDRRLKGLMMHDTEN